MDPEEVKRGIDIATVFIAYRMRSVYEVRRRLRRAELADSDVDAVIQHLTSIRLLDDRAFAGAYARDQIVGQKRGPVRASRGLAALGVSREIAREAIDEVTQSIDTFSQALQLGRKRWGQLSRVDDLTKRKKTVSDYLVRRGYPYAEVRRAVEEIESQTE